MNPEEKIQLELLTKFPYLREQYRVARPRRIFANVEYSHFAEVFEYLVREMKFTQLCTITGLDEGANLAFLYHLAQEGGVTLTLGTAVPKDNPVLQTVTPYFPQADCYERELIDLLGAQVQGLPPGHRYPLTDDWPAGQFPLRKDWQPGK